MTKNTPTPWRSVGLAIYSGDQHVLHAGGCLHSSQTDEAIANARFAVLAVNSHDELVAALTRMLDTNGMHGPCKMNNCSECRTAQKLAEAALKKAGAA